MKKICIIIITIIGFQTACAQGKILHKDSLLVDIDYLEKIVKEVHPGVYRYNSEQEINSLFKELRYTITDDITEGQLMLALAKAVKKIQCGHTYVNPWNMRKDIRNRLFDKKIYLPLGFEVLNNNMIVTENLSQNTVLKRGDKLISIDGKSAATILDSLKTVVKQDGNNYSPIQAFISLYEILEIRWDVFDI
ncbi:MAG: hypothetical protein AAF617_08135, partial [Bacteroidota bacterium]